MENVFITEDIKFKLGDWGLAAFNVRNRKCNRICGTSSNYSPQMLSKICYNSNKSDVWAMGIIIFCLVTNTRPYKYDAQLIKKDIYSDGWLNIIINKNWNLWWESHEQFNPIFKNCSVDFKNLIENMLNPNENERFSIKDVLSHKWFNQI